MERLPTEILVDILKRLHTTSVVCAKGVCKEWYNLSSHPDLANIPKKHSVVVYSKNSPNSLYVIEGNNFYDKDGLIEDKQTRHITEFALPFITSGCSINASLSCNGVLLVSYFSQELDYYLPRVTVCNPLIGKYMTLPSLPYEERRRCTYGFGFHPVTKQYKVVMNVESRHKQSFHVLTLGTSDWRLVENGRFTIAVGANGVLCEGTLNWVGFSRSQKNRKERIVSFDLFDEKFRPIPLPRPWEPIKDMQLFVLGGSLSYCTSSTHNHQTISYIYSMTKYGAKESWTAKFRIRSDLTPFATPLFLLPSGEIFLMNDNKESWNCEEETGYEFYFRKVLTRYDGFVWKDLPCYSHKTAIEASLVWPFMQQ